MLKCIKCEVEKSEEYFSWKVTGVKRNGTCRECHRVYRKEHYRQNRQKYIDKARAWEAKQGGKLFVLYGLTPEAHQELVDRYDGKCWLCLAKPANVVDHDHTTNAVRGVLCHGCNTGLGRFNDNVEGLQKAITYLERA